MPTATAPFGFPRQAVLSLNAALSGTPGSVAIALAPAAGLTFIATQGDIRSQTEYVTIGTTGAGTLIGPKVGTITHISGSGWITGAVIRTVVDSVTIAGPACFVTINPTGLTAATYTGSVTVTDARANNSPQTIPITLIVQGIIAPPLISFSGGSGIPVSFSATEGGANPTPKTITIGNDGPGALAGVAVGNQRDLLGNAVTWINPSYSAPTVTIAPLISGLTAGNYNGTCDVTSTNAGNTPRSIQVILNVSAAALPNIKISVPSLSFSATAGGADPASQTVTITELGGGALGTLGTITLGTIQYAQGAAWADTSSYAAGVVTVRCVTGTLGAGTYNCLIPIEATLAGNSPLYFPVSFTITAVAQPPVITLTGGVSTLAFTGTENVAASVPVSQTLTVANGGGGSFVNLRVQNPSASWLGVSLVGSTITVTPTVTGLIAGNYNATFDIIADNANPPVYTFPSVSLIVTAPPAQIVLTPSALTFAATAGGSNPVTQAVTVSNGGGGSVLPISLGSPVYNGPGQTWADGTTLNGSTVTVACAVGSLAPGTYTCTISVFSASSSNSPQNIGVQFNVSAAASSQLALAPSALTFNATAGGGNPANQTVAVSNSGGGSLGTVAQGTITYGAGGAQTWADTSSFAGSTETVRVVTGALPAATYTATIPITSTLAINSPQNIAVQFVVAPAAAQIQLTPNALTFTAVSGGANPSNQTVAITNAGGGSLGTLGLGTPVYPGGGPTGWADTSSLASTTITIRLATGALLPGTYTCTFPVTSTTATNSPVSLGVTFTVTSSGTGGIIPAMLPPSFLSWNPSTRQWTFVGTQGVDAPTITMPTFSGTVRNIANATDWNTAMTDLTNGTLVDGDVLNLTADITIAGQQMPKRPAATTGFVQIRSSAHASLPAYSSNFMTAGTSQRVDPAIHSALFRKIRLSATNGHITYVAGARGYWWTGIELVPDSSSVTIAEALMTMSQPTPIVAVSATSLIKDIVLDRVYIHGSGNNVQRAVWIDGERITIANSVFRNIKFFPGAGENHAISGTQVRQLLVFNTELDSLTENVLVGFYVPGVPNYVSEDMAFIRCFYNKNTAYSPSDISGWEKNWLEFKSGRRVLAYGCHFLNYDFGAQTRSIVLTADGQPSGTPFYEIRDITYMACLFEDVNGGTCNWHAQGSSSFPHLETQRIEMLHCHWKDVVPGNRSRFELGGSAGVNQQHTLNQLRIHHNCFDHNHSWLALPGAAELDAMVNFYYCDNTFKRAQQFGPIFSSSYSANIPALDGHSGVGQWTCRKNYGIAGGPTLGGLVNPPHNNALVALATDLFESPSTNDFRIKAGSIYKGAATDGTDPGPDWSLLNTATANVKP